MSKIFFRIVLLALGLTMIGIGKNVQENQTGRIDIDHIECERIRFEGTEDEIQDCVSRIGANALIDVGNHTYIPAYIGGFFAILAGMAPNPRNTENGGK